MRVQTKCLDIKSEANYSLSRINLYGSHENDRVNRQRNELMSSKPRGHYHTEEEKEIVMDDEFNGK